MIKVSRYLASANSTTLSEISDRTQSESLSGSASTIHNAKSIGDVIGNYSILTTDSRVVAMRKFLVDKGSPVYPYAESFIVEADTYGLDWRMVASISGVESAFGNITPYQTNNGWGWRGGPNGAYSQFTSWSQGIGVVTEGLARGYGTDMTPFEIEPIYCPPCGRNPAHAWANGVTRFMNELQYYLENLESI